jgi:general secretion pathway protein L
MNIVYYSKSGEFSTPISQDSLNTIIAIDSGLISTHEITLPKMSKAKALKAIPFALESRLLDDIHTLSFFPKQQAKSTTWGVLVISKTVVNKLKQQLDSNNCKADFIIPDFMLLPYSANKITYHESSDTIIFRKSRLQGGSLPIDIFKSLYNDESQLITAPLNFDKSNKFSLISANNSHWKEYFQPWRTPSAIAAALLLFLTIQLAINNNQLENQLTQLTQSNQDKFKALFPEVKRIVNIRVQTEQKFSKAKALKANYNNDLLSKLSTHSSAKIQASKLIFKSEQLTIEAIK